MLYNLLEKIMKTLIKVTQQDIYEGTPTDPRTCPLARAIGRETGKTVSVFNGSAWFGTDENRPYQELPKEACEFYGKFDAGEIVEPFEFELEVP
jgi:hypothetical protein